MHTVSVRRLARTLARVAAFAGACALAPAALAAAPYTHLFVFGDSLSDAGNNAAVIGADPAQVITGNTYVPSQPYGSNTYSNGPTWVAPFAASIGLSPFAAPSLLGGGDFAYGGAQTTIDGSSSGFPPSAATQLNGAGPAPYQFGYLTGKLAVPPQALFVVAIGGNDVRDLSVAVATNPALAATIGTQAAAYANAVGNFVDALQAKGAQNIIVWDTPDVGKTPAARAGGASFSSLATGISTAFNAALSSRLAGEAGVTIFDIFGTTNLAIANPGAFGLTNVTDACGAVVNACDPATALFWDGIHPTAKGQVLIADALFAVAVPEPETAWLFAFGVAGLVAWNRRRAAAARA